MATKKLQIPDSTGKMFRYALLGLLLILIVPKPLVSQQHSLNPKLTNGTTYGLIIGISDYKDDKIKDLKYSDRDAAEFYKFLTSEAGGKVDSSNIKLLINENATTSNIYTAKKWLENKAKKDDLVYFYFSGHGDVDSSVFQLGFLLAYDSPHKNYLNNAVRIQDFNIMANTLSINKGANVILITDACRAGKLAGSDNLARSTFFSDIQQKISDKEVRMASCTQDQNSQEDEVWGGGRGLFSFYLEKGLKGLADSDDDGIVTLLELKFYLLSNVPKEINKHNKEPQTPTFDGNDLKVLAFVNDEVKQATLNEKNNTPNNLLASNNTSRSVNDINVSAFDIYFNKLNKLEIENHFDFFALNKMPANKILEFVTNNDVNYSDENDNRLSLSTYYFSKELKEKENLKQFGEYFASAIHNRVQAAINLYLEGDEAELEKRRYYNAFSNGYDEFLPMMEVAMKLIEVNDPLYRIFEVKKNYFQGIVSRIKMPVSDNVESLLNTAFKSQQKAIALEPNAAYVNNEMGVLHYLKKDFINAEKYFKRATELSLNWSIPWSNLCLVYKDKNEIDKAKEAGSKAETLQNDLQLSKVALGMLYEKEKNYMLAEEYYREAIQLNQRYYLPFERLGNIYLNITKYDLADSFYFEAEVRKKGLNYAGNKADNIVVMMPLPFMSPKICELDTSKLLEDDFFGYFYWGMQEYRMKNYPNAERIFSKVIKIDPYNPLVFHYLAKVYYDQNKWEEAEDVFKYAKTYLLEGDQFQNYVSNAINKMKAKHLVVNYDIDCFVNFYIESDYNRIDNYFFLGQIYENLQYHDEAENVYHTVISDFEEENINRAAIQKLNALLEKNNRWQDAENLRLEAYYYCDEDYCDKELNGFYRRAIVANENEGSWPHKLGLFLYTKASLPNSISFYDTIVYLPKLGKEFFIDKQYYNSVFLSQIYDRNVTGDTTITYKTIFDNLNESSVFGTDSLIYYQPAIFNPRKDAIYFLTKALSFFKDDADVSAALNHKIGNVYVWAGSKKQAYPYFENAVKLSDKNISSRLNAIDGALHLYKNRNALNHLQYLDEKSKLDINNRIVFSELLMHNRQYEASESSINKTISYHPYQLIKALNLKARLSLFKANYDLAISQYQNYLVQKENDLDSYYSKTEDTNITINTMETMNADGTSTVTSDTVMTITNKKHFEPRHKDNSTFTTAEINTYYTIARAYALKGDKNLALQWLKKSIDKGFAFTYVLDYDTELKKIFKNGDWKKEVKIKGNIPKYKSFFENKS